MSKTHKIFPTFCRKVQKFRIIFFHFAGVGINRNIYYFTFNKMKNEKREKRKGIRKRKGREKVIHWRTLPGAPGSEKVEIICDHICSQIILYFGETHLLIFRQISSLTVSPRLSSSCFVRSVATSGWSLYIFCSSASKYLAEMGFFVFFCL